MNTVPSSHEKRSIKVKDFLNDFQSGLSDMELLRKYNLTPVGLDKFYGMLIDRGILDPGEIQARNAQESTPENENHPIELEESSFICPSCLASHEAMFDICQNCGASFQDLISGEKLRESEMKTEEKPEVGPSASSLDWDKDFADYFSHEPQAEAQPAGEQALETKPATTVAEKNDSDEFGPAPAGGLVEGGFEDTREDIMSAIPLADTWDEPVGAPEENGIKCESCEEELAPALRDIYDHRRSRLALILCGVFAVVAVLGFASLAVFTSYSAVRMIAVAVTGLSLIFSAVFCGVGAFMELAREKVYFCPSCNRVYPRG